MLSENEVVEINLEEIIPNRFQPREVFDEKALKELAASIKAHGVIQPIIVRNIGEKYEIIAGERRYKASAIAGLTKIPAIIRNLDDKESSKVALLENLQRKDLTSIEEARTYQKILEIDELTQDELAKTMGKSQSAIANKIRLLSLPEEVQEALLNERISERHARSLLNLKDSNKQIEMLNKVILKRMTVKDLEQEIKNMTGIETEMLEILEEQNVESQSVSQNSLTTKSQVTEETDLDALLAKIQKEIEEEEKNLNNEENQVIENNTVFQNPVEEPKKGLDFLLGSHSNNITNIDDDINIDNLPAIDSLVGIPNKEVSLVESKLPVFDSLEEPVAFELEEKEEFVKPTLMGAIREVREKIQNLEQKGFSINVEEIDFEDTYQIIIKVNKNK